VAALRPTGRLIVVGLPPSDLRIPMAPMLAERSVSGASAGGPTDITQMLDFVARSGVRPMIETFPMSEVNAALDRVRSGKVRFRAVLVA
jgi:alcohol/geraniol dehydrogenase (NADP+)